MKYKYFLTFLLFVQISYSEDINELILPKCDGRNIYYSIIGNMKDFITNYNKIDESEIYEEIDDIKKKKIGALKGSSYNISIFKNVSIYEKYDDLINDLKKYKLDVIIMDNGISNYTQAFDMDISFLKKSTGSNKYAFGFQKNNTKYLNELNEFLENFRSNIGTKEYNLGFNDENSIIDLEGGNGTINVIYRTNIPPYSYRFKGDIIGNEISFIYASAQRYDYKINLLEAQTIQEQVDCLKNKNCDIAGGLFPILDEYKDVIVYSNIFLIITKEI